MPDVRNALIFTPDNSFDIGASGATRPRDAFLGRNLGVGGTLALADGSSLTPSLVFTSSQTTGLYRQAADSIGFATNGLARWAMNASGHFIAPADNTYDLGHPAPRDPETSSWVATRPWAAPSPCRTGRSAGPAPPTVG